MRGGYVLILLGIILMAVIQASATTYADATTTVPPGESSAMEDPIVGENISVRTYRVVVDNVSINYTVILTVNNTCNGYMWIFVKTAKYPDGRVIRDIHKVCDGEIVNPIVVNTEFTTSNSLWVRAVMEAVVKSVIMLRINDIDFTLFSIQFAEIVSLKDQVIAVVYVLGNKTYEVIYDFVNHRVLATGESLFPPPHQYPWTYYTLTVACSTAENTSKTTPVGSRTRAPPTITTKLTPRPVENGEYETETTNESQGIHTGTTSPGYRVTETSTEQSSIERTIIIILVSISVALASHIFVKRSF